MKSTAKKKLFINNMITLGMVVAAWIIMEVLMGTGHVSSLLKGLLVPFCIYVIMAVSLNLTVGILGELSLGHAGFMCVGAFSGALFSKCMKGAIDPTVSLVIAIFVGAAVAAVFGILIGIPVLRLRGDYLAIVTLAFGEIIKNLVNAIFLGRDADGFHISFKDSMSLGLKDGGEVLIKGPQGITGTPQAATFTIGIILVLITLIIVMNLVNSRTGRAIMSCSGRRCRRSLCPQPYDTYCSPEELRLQHVHHDPCIRGSRRNRKHPWICDLNRHPLPASGAFKRFKQLPYADLRHRPDPRDALQLCAAVHHAPQADLRRLKTAACCPFRKGGSLKCQTC